jgi:hypothetical protein
LDSKSESKELWAKNLSAATHERAQDALAYSSVLDSSLEPCAAQSGRQYCK